MTGCLSVHLRESLWKNVCEYNLRLKKEIFRHILVIFINGNLIRFNYFCQDILWKPNPVEALFHLRIKVKQFMELKFRIKKSTSHIVCIYWNSYDKCSFSCEIRSCTCQINLWVEEVIIPYIHNIYSQFLESSCAIVRKKDSIKTNSHNC